MVLISRFVDSPGIKHGAGGPTKLKMIRRWKSKKFADVWRGFDIRDRSGVGIELKSVFSKWLIVVVASEGAELGRKSAICGRPRRSQLIKSNRWLIDETDDKLIN